MSLPEYHQPYIDAVTASREKADTNRSRFAERFLHDTRRWRLSAAQSDFLARISTRPISGRALVSNVRVRKALQHSLITALADEYVEHPRRQWLWVTICWDTGVTWERKPEVDYVSLRGIAYRHLQRSGLEGFGMVETDVWKAIAGEPGRRLVNHVHFLGYPLGGAEAGVTALAADMGERTALANSLQARSVVINNVRKTPADFARIGQYLGKPPIFAKNPIPTLGGNKFRLQDVEHVGGSVARLTEIFSYCEVGDLMFSIGGGQSIARQVRTAVRHEVRERSGARPSPSREETQVLWQQIRQINGSKNFEPCRIITRAHQRGE